MEIRSLFFWLIIIIFPSYSFATIVFIDVNNSINEVQVAKKEAAARGEDLIVLPNSNLQTAQKIKTLQKEAKSALNSYEKANCYGQMLCNGKFSDPQCESLSRRAYDFQVKVKNETQGKLTPQSISEAFQKIYAEQKSVSSVIISGEDGGSVFGTYGTISYPDLKQTFESVPQLKNDVQSLYLWGCYTGTPGRYSEVWQDALPGTKFLIGFHDAGPASTSTSGIDLLGKVMRQETSAFSSYGKTEVEHFFKSFPEVKNLNVSMCINGRYIDKKNEFLLSEYNLTGEKCAKEFPAKLRDRFLCYYDSLKGCENPPTNHQSSDLRSYYSYLRNNAICLANTDFRNVVRGEVGDPDSVMRLIYWDRVWDNFLHHYGQDMKRFSTILRAIGLPPSLQFAGDQKTTRAEFLDWTRRVNEALATRHDPRSDYAKSIMEQIEGIAGLSRWYVPDSWVTGVSTEQAHYKLEVRAECDVNN